MTSIYNLDTNGAIITIIIVILFSASGCVSYQEPEEDTDGITALVSFDILNEKINTTSIVIESVTMTGNSESGLSDSWRFYCVEFINSTALKTSSVTITSDNNSNINVHGYTSIYEKTVLPITNWTIDSDEAYNIAVNNTEISEYLNSTNNNAKIGQFTLYGRENNSAVWSILWETYGYLGFGQSHIKIEIDASTGEVLYTGPAR